MAIKSDARLRMINSALELFHLQGVDATSIDQVLERSGTGKSQFTHYFKNKEGLVHAVIQFLHDVIKSGAAPTGYDIKSWEDMETWFQKYIDFQRSVSFELSCPIGTIGNDISNEQELLRQDVRLFLEWCRNQFIRFFAERKAAGELVAMASPEGLADLCISIMQGGMLLTKIKRSPETFENAAAQALHYIHSLRIKK
ncbi:TetR/AcrR family transcriptional regulator [Bdellovibrio bacteriovorus]|uniref:TetR/AcrR family transcriptional regulator n=1 Tax=Bdellovibrio bacteriovorus TaxID=959 RepID=UPI0035A65069